MSEREAPLLKSNWVWMNGQLMPNEKATTSVCSNGLQYGMGVFEGIRAYRQGDGLGIFRLDAHLERLEKSAAAYGMRLPYSRTELQGAIEEVLQANQFDGESAYLRPIFWFGAGMSARYRPVEGAVILWPWPINFSEERSRSGVRVTIPPWKKIHYSMLPSTAKGCGQYLTALLAVQYALMNGFDEALLLDASGNLAEGAAENIFLVKNGTLLTNDENSSILLGVTRDSVITIARDLGIKVEIRTLSQDDLYNADEAFFTGTAIEIVGIREVSGRSIGNAGNVSVTGKIRAAFHAITRGQNERYKDWIHQVPATVARASAYKQAV